MKERRLTQSEIPSGRRRSSIGLIAGFAISFAAVVPGCSPSSHDNRPRQEYQQQVAELIEEINAQRKGN